MRIAISLISGFTLMFFLATASATEAVVFRNGTLSVAIDQVSLRQLIPWLEKSSGVVVEAPPALLEQTLTKQFDGLPLKQGLNLLFEGYGRALTYKREQGELKVASLRIFSKGEKHVPQYQQAPIRTPVDDMVQLDLMVKEVVIERDRHGRFAIQGMVNHTPALLLVDTGATSVVLSGDFAAYLGLPYGQQRDVSTAGGVVFGYATRIDHLSFGAIEQSGVEGIVLPQMQGRTVLLGMSVLQQYEMRQQGDRLHLKVLQ